MTEAAAVPEKVPDLWLDDGNLIVLAGNKAFRMYQGLLSRRSTVFQNMLSIPQPHSTDAVDEPDKRNLKAMGVDPTGCAVVRLPDDPEEVDWFLSAFLSDNLATRSDGTNDYTSNFAGLTGILRLASKYEVGFLRRWAVSWLEGHFTTNEQGLREDAQLGSQPDIDGLLSLADVALTTEVPWILPRIYWRLHHTPLKLILQHNEWTALSDARRATILLGRDAAQEEIKGLCAHIIEAHDRNVSAHTAGEACAILFRHLMLQGFLKHGAQGYYASSGYNTDLERYLIVQNRCYKCQRLYDLERGKLLQSAFASVQRHYGLVDSSELRDLRTNYHADTPQP